MNGEGAAIERVGVGVVDDVGNGAGLNHVSIAAVRREKMDRHLEAVPPLVMGPLGLLQHSRGVKRALSVPGGVAEGREHQAVVEMRGGIPFGGQPLTHRFGDVQLDRLVSIERHLRFQARAHRHLVSVEKLAARG